MLWRAKISQQSPNMSRPFAIQRLKVEGDEEKKKKKTMSKMIEKCDLKVKIMCRIAKVLVLSNKEQRDDPF